MLTQKLSRSGSELQLEYGPEVTGGRAGENEKISNIYSGCDWVGGLLGSFLQFSQIKKKSECNTFI